MSQSSTTPHLTETPAWDALQHLALGMEDSSTTIADLFSDDARRANDFSLAAAGLFMDYSKHLLTREARDALVALAESAGMPAAITAMFAGEQINNTEQRAVLHVALRSPHANSAQEQQVHAALEQMEVFVGSVIAGDWKGHSGQAITDIVNIGIGGSDLGPAMAYAALAPFHVRHIRCHFVSNVDPVHLEQTLATLDPATTLFIIASKTFTTLETMLNATAARQWILDSGVTESGLARHFVGVSANVEKAAAFGITPDNIFPMWDWVGGRYSLWSAIGLSIALGTGMENFRAMLSGAHAMDEHFRTAPLAANMPVMMALLALWYHNFWQTESAVVLPYAQNLHLFPAFLQQLDMESLGKQVRRDASPMTVVSGGIVWGSAGTNGQHSFHQLLHQGTHLIPADFIAVKESASANREMHEHLLANCFAQSQALMQGKDLAQATAELQVQGLDASSAALLAPHRVVPGNRPSTTFLLDKLTPHSLGALTALYEHKVYAHSVLLGLNAFDQWGVELGKVLGKGIYQAITADVECHAFDASTNGLINRVKSGHHA
jgi:glucose-6-phosphate isomerase